MIEKAVRSLYLLQVHRHFSSGAVYILPVTRSQISLRLYGGYHKHVVNPYAGLPGIALPGIRFLLRLGIDRNFPLGISILHSKVEVLPVAQLLHIDFKGDSTHHVIVYVHHAGKHILFCSKQGFEAFLQPLLHIFILHGFAEP